MRSSRGNRLRRLSPRFRTGKTSRSIRISARPCSRYSAIETRSSRCKDAPAAGRSGYAVCGIAPTTMAARELAGSGIKSQTLQRFLITPRQDGEGKRLIVLDESSLSDTRRINALLKRLGEEERILLVGDRDQHQAVEAGAPFEQRSRCFRSRGGSSRSSTNANG